MRTPRFCFERVTLWLSDRMVLEDKLSVVDGLSFSSLPGVYCYTLQQMHFDTPLPTDPPSATRTTWRNGTERMTTNGYT